MLRWGDPQRAVTLSDELLALLRQALGIEHAAPPDAPVRLPERTLDGALRARLVAIVGEEHVREDADARTRHLRGCSTPDLLRARSGDGSDAPDAVVLPGDADEVLAVLGACSQHGVAVTPHGGGTSVVGGLPGHGIALDLARLDALLEVDAVSRTATLQPGLRGPAAEELLGEHGLTLGHHPQSFEYATIGGFAATRSSGQASAGYGRFDERVVALELATPVGLLSCGRAPRSAAGPDLRQLVLGSEGTLGVITQVTVEVVPRPRARVYEGWRLPSFAAGQDALRALAQDGPLPTVLRLSDEAETALGLARPDALGEGGGGCLAICGFEGTPADVAARRAGAAEVLRARGAEGPDEAAGAGWHEGRYSAPYLRDALLDAGALVETLETACFWSALPALYEAVRGALVDALRGAGTPPVVLCHVSHVYRSGASLYFTVGAAAAEDPLAQWAAAKRAASDAIADAVATITHHHGVGADHREHYAREVGPLGLQALRAVKSVLDPRGIMNPGVLL